MKNWNPYSSIKNNGRDRKSLMHHTWRIVNRTNWKDLQYKYSKWHWMISSINIPNGTGRSPV
jgi:hypothetical protein